MNYAKKNGFTLAEVVITIFISGLIIVLLGAIFYHVTKSINNSQNEAKVFSEIEEFKNEIKTFFKNNDYIDSTYLVDKDGILIMGSHSMRFEKESKTLFLDNKKINAKSISSIKFNKKNDNLYEVKIIYLLGSTEKEVEMLLSRDLFN